MDKPAIRVVDPTDEALQEELLALYGPLLPKTDGGRCNTELDLRGLNLGTWNHGLCCRGQRHRGPHVVRRSVDRQTTVNGYAPGQIVAYQVATLASPFAYAA